MKKCPFCAEEIQPEAIKCKHCGSFLQGRAPSSSGPAGTPLRAPAPAQAPHADDEKRLLYEGSPSWRADFGGYLVASVVPVLVAAGAFWAVERLAESSATFRSPLARYLALLVPLAVGALVLFVKTLIRRATRVRVTNRGVEVEQGLFSKRIDVLELWRVRDVLYRQSFFDRILGIAHIDLFTKDVTTPHLQVLGLPASRELFERLRDSIEIQRQSRRVMGLVD